MGFSRRKLLPVRNAAAALCNCDPYLNPDGYCLESCFKVCPDVCRNIIVFGSDVMSPPVFSSPPPPPPPPPSRLSPPLTDYIDRTHYTTNQKHLIETSMIVGACMIGVSVILCILFAIMRFYSNRRNRRSRSPVLFASQEDFLDGDHGPVLDHPIWYIHTVGLPQALIDKITIFKYRKDEGLTDGIDCSVCLSEFEEDQSLRLLPKCSHAFHIPCIDTWLRSHKNCPLCRAPVFSSTASAQVSVPDSISSGSGSGDSIPLENLENVEGVGRGSSEVVVTDDENVGAILVDEMNVESSEKVLADSRALSDLADNRRVTEDGLQPVRRSVSMDSMSASRVYRDVANVIPEQGSSNSQVVLVKSAKSGILSKQASASSSLFKHLRSSSNGSSLQMGPISMKRPFPPSRKLFSSKHGRSVSSILPL